MAKTTKATAAKPLKQLEQLLPKITHEELLKLTQGAHAEIGRRAEQYADAIYEIEEPPVDLMNEALSFCARAHDLLPHNFSTRHEPRDDLRQAEKDIKNALNGLGKDDDEDIEDAA